MIFLITWSVSAKPVRYSLYKARYLSPKDYRQHTRDRTREVVMRRLSAADAESHMITIDSNLWNCVNVGTRLTAIVVPMPQTVEGKLFRMFETTRHYLRIPTSARTTIPAISNVFCLRILILQAKKICTKAEVMPYSKGQNHTNARNVRYPQSYQELGNINSQHVPTRM